MINSEFELLKEAELAEAGGTVSLWRHKESGAEVLSVKNDDENKCFGVSFYTPPADSTGVAHILEHSVLCGSKKYPVKEPFVELLKGSLQTFLNAFTFPDKTCYPVASANLRDFYNLVDVYLDAVFHPLISENIFRQEGWHVEADAVDAPWIYKGVVFNEMKGVYSQADSILAEKSQQAVFPDNLYSLDSGGNPVNIPDLTWKNFHDFHSRLYHPSNAFFFFWGDDPEDQRLRIVAEAVAGAKRKNKIPGVPLQEKLAEPGQIVHYYPAEAGENRALFTMNWLLPERGDVYAALKLEMLEHILEGLPGSPLRRALIESGLGEDTTGCGLETDLRQMYYSTGLKGILPENIGKARDLIMQALVGLAENGIPAEMVGSAINSIEFAYRENNSGRFPRGLAAMIQSLSTWLYGGNPLEALAWEKPLASIKDRIAAGEKLFEAAIKEYFLDNTHCMTVILLPDEKLAMKRQDAERAKLDSLQNGMSDSEKEKLVRLTDELKKAQLSPDRPEDLAKIPSLKISDLPEKEKTIPANVKAEKNVILSHELATNGILYANLLLKPEKLPSALTPLLPLFCRSLLEFGTGSRDYAELGLKIASTTGGIGVAPLPGLTAERKEPFLYLSLQGKSVESHLTDLFDLFSEMLLDPQNNKEVMISRLSRMIPEEKARLEYGLQAAGHLAVSTRLRARYRPEQALLEQFSGISQLRYIRELEKRLAKEPDRVIRELEELRSLVIASSNSVFDFTGNGAVLEKGLKLGEKLVESLPKNPRLSEGTKISEYPEMRDLPSIETFLTQGQVNYVAKGANLYDLGYKFHGSANVIMRWLRMGPLWENVRVAGGAYGASCSLDRIGGTYVCSSYRDPNVEKTLNSYDNLAVYLQSFRPTESQLSQAIIGAIGDLDAYLLPDAKGAKALGWHLSGETAEERQRMRDEMFSTTGKDFNNFADVLAAAARKGSVCVLGGNGAAEYARKTGCASSSL